MGEDFQEVAAIEPSEEMEAEDLVDPVSERVLALLCAAATLSMFSASAYPHLLELRAASESVPANVAAIEKETRELSSGVVPAERTREAKTDNAEEPDQELPIIASLQVIEPSQAPDGPGPTDEVGASSGGLLPVSYSLVPSGAADETRAGQDGDQIRVTKQIVHAGQAIGTVPVVISSGSELFVSGADLKAVLTQVPEQAALTSNLPESDLVSFRRLRSLGIDLRYDPATDRLNLHANP